MLFRNQNETSVFGVNSLWFISVARTRVDLFQFRINNLTSHPERWSTHTWVSYQTPHIRRPRSETQSKGEHSLTSLNATLLRVKLGEDSKWANCGIDLSFLLGASAHFLLVGLRSFAHLFNREWNGESIILLSQDDSETTFLLHSFDFGLPFGRLEEMKPSELRQWGAALSVDTCPYLRSSWNVSFFVCNWISFGWADPCLPLTPSFRLHPCFGIPPCFHPFDVGDRNRCPFTEGRNQSVDLGFHLCLSILPRFGWCTQCDASLRAMTWEQSCQ